MFGRNGNSVEGEVERERKDSNINVPLEKFKYHSQFGEFDTNFFSYEIIKDIANYLLDNTTLRPKIGIICGSGLGSLADGLQRPQGFRYEEIPHFPVSTVKGHAGRLVFGMLEGVPVMCMQGRFHCYEGYPLWKCAMPVRLMKMIGVTHLIVTNAAGGLCSDYKVGDIMIIKDHINMMGFAGNSALNGPNDERFGPRFPAMNKAYDAELRNEAKKIANNLGMKNMIHEGIYTCLGGPNYETIAELRMLKKNGVDAVGMSTIPEVITAKHCGLTVFAFSLITNACILDYEDEQEANHEEVVETGKQREPLLKKFVSQIVLSMHKKGTI
ncbi:UNVERIFIED_CONTAM: hypothetical protein PYX00_008429 [Menopon gallinae]|uniref:Purine nucleoside phosphorylase n=1 Tax=Menopon gallinae TaxID=328185 RepID=A0AAW2HMY5_9NEOP